MNVLLSAYACEPGKGSEPGAGWHFATAAAAAGHDVTVMTRANNRIPIEQGLAELPDRERLSFVFVDLPARAMFWKRGSRGVRTYYLLWQIAAARVARRLHREHRFDLVHHVTFANVWQPALACLVRAPFVLGPVGGGPAVPFRLYPALGLRGALNEASLHAARAISRGNPLVRLACHRAALILVQNDETAARLPRKARQRALVRPNATADPVLARIAVERSANSPHRAVLAGRLPAWKGALLAVDALAHAPGWHLEVIGDGADRSRMQRRAAELGITDRITFTARIAQADLADKLVSADAMLLPSLREDASFAAVEAQALGVPVVAFDRGGPRVLAREPRSRFVLVPLVGRAESARALALALERSLATPRSSALPDYSPGRLAHELGELYSTLAQTTVAAGKVQLA